MAATAGLLSITAGILVVLLFRSFVQNLIMSEIPLLPGSKVTKAWIDPPVRPLLRLYFFNTTNPAGFLRGQKPRLQEVGPYVYEEEWHKVGVVWRGRCFGAEVWGANVEQAEVEGPGGWTVVEWTGVE